MISWNPIDWFQSGDYDSSTTENESSLTGYLARNAFTDDEEERLYSELAKQDNEKALAQLQNGQITKASYFQTASLANSLDDNYEKLGGKGIGGFLNTVPIWLWAAVGIAAFFYFGGMAIIRRNFTKP